VRARAAGLLLVALAGCGPGDETPSARERAELAAHRQQGLDLLRLGLYEGARAELERCLTLDPDQAEVHGHLARLHAEVAGRADAPAEREEALDLAWRHARRAFALDPSAPGLARQVFALAIEHGEDPALAWEAVEAAREAGAAPPGFAREVLAWLAHLVDPAPRGPSGPPGVDVLAALAAWRARAEPELGALAQREARGAFRIGGEETADLGLAADGPDAREAAALATWVDVLLATRGGDAGRALSTMDAHEPALVALVGAARLERERALARRRASAPGEAVR